MNVVKYCTNCRLDRVHEVIQGSGCRATVCLICQSKLTKQASDENHAQYTDDTLPKSLVQITDPESL